LTVFILFLYKFTYIGVQCLYFSYQHTNSAL
jgi:hypothetical protein